MAVGCDHGMVVDIGIDFVVAAAAVVDAVAVDAYCAVCGAATLEPRGLVVDCAGVCDVRRCTVDAVAAAVVVANDVKLHLDCGGLLEDRI